MVGKCSSSMNIAISLDKCTTNKIIREGSYAFRKMLTTTNLRLPIAISFDNALGHLIPRCVAASKQLELSAALLDEQLKRLDDHPALVRVLISLTQKRRRLCLVGQLV